MKYLTVFTLALVIGNQAVRAEQLKGWNMITYTGVTAGSLDWDQNGMPVLGPLDLPCQVRTLVKAKNNNIQVYGFDVQATGLYSGRLRILSYLNPVQFINAKIQQSVSADDDLLTAETEQTSVVLSGIPVQDPQSLSDTLHTLRFNGGLIAPTVIRTDFTQNSDMRALTMYCKVLDVTTKAVTEPFLL